MNTELIKKKKKNHNLIWIITGTLALIGIGTGIYFFTRNNPSSNQSNQTLSTSERIQQLNNQLVQIKTALTTLTNNITQTETSLQTKRTEYEQSPQDSLQTEINQLESQLTTYKTQKQKIETLLPEIESQINNLGQENNTDSKKQAEIIKNLEKDIQQINKDLGIKVDGSTPRKLPDDKKDPDLSNSSLQDLLADLKVVEDYLIECNKHNEANPNNPNYQLDKNKYSFGLDDIENIKKRMKFSSPAQDEIIKTRKEFREKWSNVFKDSKGPNQPSPDKNPGDNLSRFQRLQKQSAELKTEIEKINQKYQQERNKWNSETLAVRTLADAMCGGKLEDFYKNLTPFSVSSLEPWISDSEYQNFLTLSPEAQKKNIELIDVAFFSSLKEVKDSLTTVNNHFKELLKLGKQMVDELEKKIGKSPESIRANQEIQKQVNITVNCERKLDSFDRTNNYSELITIIKEVWQGLEQLEWNQKNK